MPEPQLQPEAPAPAPRSVQIRLGTTEADLDAMIDMAHAVHAESRYKDFPFDAEAYRASWQAKLTGKPNQYGLLLAELDARPVGMLLAQVGRNLFFSGLAAQCTLLYVRPENRGGMAAVKLLHGFRRWAENRKARSISVHVTAGIDTERVDRFLEHMGMERTGGNFESLL